MDKNMINIDDLFKQRFNREEEERPGAWLRMRDLLDDKMPVNAPAAGVNWRRMLSYVAGIALLATVTVGSYEVATKSRSNDDASRLASTVAGVPEHRSLASRTASELMVNGNKGNTQTTNASGINTDSKNATSNTEKVAENSNNSINKNINHTHLNRSKSSNYNSESTEENTNGTVANATNNLSKRTDNHINNNGNGSDISYTSGTATKTGAGDNSSGSLANNGVKHPKHAHAASSKLMLSNGSIASGNTLNDSHNKLTDNNLGNNNTDPSGSSSKYAVGNKEGKHNNRKHNQNDINTLLPASGSVASGFTGASVAADKTSRYIAKVETINALEVRQHLIVDPETHKASYKSDTIGKLPINKYVFTPIDEVQDAKSVSENTSKGYAANSKGKKNSNEDATLLPAADLNSSAAANSTAKEELAKKRAASSKWDWRSFSDALKDFEYNMGQVKVFPGVIGGVNTTFFGPSSSTGFHLGMTTEFEFNDHWGMMAELKYMQRVNNGVLNNNYVTYKAIDSSGTPQHMAYIIQKDSIQHYFNYSTLHSLELPISLHYKAGNFSMFGGANLVYNFTINTEEIDHKFLSAPTTETFPGNNWQNTLKNSPKYTINDFSSIFGIGYLLGLSYEFTPSIMVDARMTQMVWDNAKTLGAKQISSNLYQSPSAQLSIIYRLNHKKSEVYDK